MVSNTVPATDGSLGNALVKAGPTDIAKRAQPAQRYPLVVTLILVTVSIFAALFAAIRLFGLTDQGVTTTGLFHLSTFAIFIAMAFACLGFGLFLVHATGAFKGNANGSGRSGSFDTAAPGLVVIVCATIIIYLAIDLVRPATPASTPAQTQGAKP